MHQPNLILQANLMKVLAPILVPLKEEVARMRAAGAHQVDIDRMVQSFVNMNANTLQDDEGQIVVALIREAAAEHRSGIGTD